MHKKTFVIAADGFDDMLVINNIQQKKYGNQISSNVLL